MRNEKHFRNLLRNNLFRLDNHDDIFKYFKKGNRKKIDFFNRKIKIYNRKLKNLSFEKKIKFLMKKGNMPSLTVCTIDKDLEVWPEAFGKSNIEKNINATIDTVYMIASISKTITATAIMQLVDENLLDIENTDVSEYLGFKLRNPKYPDEKITLKMLLAHRSSIKSSSEVRWFLYYSLLDYPPDFFKEYFLPGGSCYHSDVWADYKPGEESDYSSEGIDLASYVIKNIKEQIFEKYCIDNIFQKIDMNRTKFHLSDYFSDINSGFDIDNFAVPYLYSRTGFIALPHYDIGTVGSGGVRSTVDDLSHYLIAHMNNGVYNDVRILSKKSVEEMHKKQYPEPPGEKYYFGLGWYTIIRDDKKEYGGHDGVLPGFRLVMRTCEEDKTGVIFFYNRYHHFKFREKYRHIGWVEEWARTQVEKLLFEKANQ